MRQGKRRFVIIALAVLGLSAILTAVPAFSTPDADTDTGGEDRYITGAVWNGTAASSFAGGTGTRADPYLLYPRENS